MDALTLFFFFVRAFMAIEAPVTYPDTQYQAPIEQYSYANCDLASSSSSTATRDPCRRGRTRVCIALKEQEFRG